MGEPLGGELSFIASGLELAVVVASQDGERHQPTAREHPRQVATRSLPTEAEGICHLFGCGCWSSFDFLTSEDILLQNDDLFMRLTAQQDQGGQSVQLEHYQVPILHFIHRHEYA